MAIGQNDGDSDKSLTVSSAASVFERLFSQEDGEHPETEENKTADEQSTGDDSVEKEPADEQPDDESTSEDEESESDQENDQDDDEVEEESNENTPEPDTKSKTRKIKVDGEEIEVTEEELEKGYSRTADYTRKTQKLAEDKKSFETEQTAVREERKQLADHLTQLKSAIESLTPKEPDWDTLRIEDPEGFPIAWAEWQQHQSRMQKLSAAQQEAIRKVQADQNKHQEELIQREQELLLEAFPTWKDATVAKKELGELSDYAKTYGFTDDDLNAITDHRVFKMLNKARLFDEAQKKQPVIKKKIEAVKAATPGASSKTSRSQSKRDKLRQRLRRSGSVRDAAALFELDD